MDSTGWKEFVEDNPDRVAGDTADGKEPGPRISEHTDQPLESEIQIDVVQWARAAQSYRPALTLLHSTPNEGMVDMHPATARKRKRMGIVSGVPDLCLPVPSGEWPTLYLELKREGEDLRPEQYEILQALQQAGVAVEVAWTAEQAIWAITHYLDTPETFLSGY